MEISLTTIVIALLALVFYALCTHLQSSTNKDNFPPGPKGLPVIGNTVLLQRNLKTLTEYGKVYGGLFSLRLFGKRFIVLNDWKTLRDALVGQSEIFSGRINFYAMKQVNQFNDISTSDGPPWKENRIMAVKLLRKFGFFKQTMEDTILDEISKLFQFIDERNDKPVEINKCFYMPIFNVIWGIVTGTTYEYDDPLLTELMERVQLHLRRLTTTMPINALPWLRFLPFDPFEYKKLIENVQQIKQYIKKIIDDHMKRSDAESEPRDFIDGYLAEIPPNANKQYKLESLIGITVNLLVAGIDTTKSTLEYGLMYMAHWPHIQNKVQQELDTIIGKDRTPTHADISTLPFTEATVLEIHRYCTIVPLSVPHRTLAKTQLRGYTIPKDTVVIPNIWAVHNDKALWGDPEVFRPERFLDADGQVEKPEYLIHFGIGGRSCIGLPLVRKELFLLLACLLQRYSFANVPNEPIPSFDPVSMRTLARCPKPFRLLVKHR